MSDKNNTLNDIKTNLDDNLLEKDRKKEKLKEKFQKLARKKQILYLLLIFIAISLIANLAIGIGLHFTPLLNQSKQGILKLLPGNIILELLLLWSLSFVAFFVLYPLYPLIATLYIYVHKLIKINRYNYSKVETDEYIFTFKEILNRGLSPYLFCFVIGYWTVEKLFLPRSNLGDIGISELTLIYFLFGYICIPLIIFLISPLWLLNDAGIIAIRKRKEGEREIPKIVGASTFFENFYTGSAITLAITTFIVFFIEIFTTNFQIEVFIAFWFIILILLPSHFLAIGYIYENTLKQNKKRIIKIIPKKLVDMTPKTIVDKINFFVDIEESEDKMEDKYLGLLVEMEAKADEILDENH